MRDPTVWEEPETIKPERFLDADGKYIRQDGLIPFGLGKTGFTNNGSRTI